jgi:hypothetical protein
MSADIGFNDGITAFESWFRNLSMAIDLHNDWRAAYIQWCGTDRKTAPPIPPKFPTIPLEGALFNENVMSTWPWPRKFFRNTMRKLKDYYDAVNPNNPGNGEPPPTPVDPHFGIAPRTYNYAEENNSDPLFCKNSPGVVVHADGSFSDKFSRYDSNGKDIDGLRNRFRMVPGLNKSNNTNGLDPCTLYNGLTKWPNESYER